MSTLGSLTPRQRSRQQQQRQRQEWKHAVAERTLRDPDDDAPLVVVADRQHVTALVTDILDKDKARMRRDTPEKGDKAVETGRTGGGLFRGARPRSRSRLKEVGPVTPTRQGPKNTAARPATPVAAAAAAAAAATAAAAVVEGRNPTGESRSRSLHRRKGSGGTTSAHVGSIQAVAELSAAVGVPMTLPFWRGDRATSGTSRTSGTDGATSTEADTSAGEEEGQGLSGTESQEATATTPTKKKVPAVRSLGWGLLGF